MAEPSITKRQDGVIVCKQTYKRGDKGFAAPLIPEHDAVAAKFGSISFIGAYPSKRTEDQYTHESHWKQIG